MYTLENNSFENKRMRVQYKQLENKQRRTYKEVGGGKIVWKGAQSNKMANKNNSGITNKIQRMHFWKGC